MNQQMTHVANSQKVATSRAGLTGTEIEMRRETAAIAVAERARAEVTARYQMAIHRPRSVADARSRIIAHCQRRRFAEAARYSKPIGGNNSIVGPSIRFVESALAEYGNILVQSSVVWDDADERRVEISVTDLERNLSYPKEVVIRKTVERRSLRRGQAALGQRRNSYGDIVYIVEATEDDLLIKQGALESKAIRTLGLRVLPADIVEEAMDAVVETLRSEDERDPAAARKRMADSFAELGVYPRQLEEYLGHPLDQTTPAEREALTIVYATLRDGEAKWSEILEAQKAERGEEPATAEEEPEKPAKKSKAAAALAKKKAEREKKKAEVQKRVEQAKAPEPPAAGEDDLPSIPPPSSKPDPDDPDAQAEAILQAMRDGDFSGQIRARIRKLPPDLQAELNAVYDAGGDPGPTEPPDGE
jgi:hypothetical protein